MFNFHIFLLIFTSYITLLEQVRTVQSFPAVRDARGNEEKITKNQIKMNELGENGSFFE